MLSLLRSVEGRFFRSTGLLLWLLLSLVACSPAAEQQGDSTALDSQPSETSPEASYSAPESETETDSAATDGVVRLRVLYTNDEHGWMEGKTPGEGAAQLHQLWRQQENLEQDPAVLVLSGGDMWTGPAISTWFGGASMVEVMNAMGYAAAAVGNHEFDFGLDVLQRNAAASQFPFLSANLRQKSDAQVPLHLGIKPWTLVQKEGLSIGIVGLSLQSTPLSTKASNVADFDFIDYEMALREVVPEMRRQGAQVILATTHICRKDLIALAQSVADLGISLFGGGHCHQRFAERIGNTAVIGGGGDLVAYAKAELEYDPLSQQVSIQQVSTHFNQAVEAESTKVAQTIAYWQAQAATELDRVIGYSAAGLSRRSDTLQALVVQSWLQAYPAADIALNNLGGIRADMPAGNLTVGDVIGIMPFDNTLVEVNLSGAELANVMNGRDGNTAAAGMRWNGNQWIDTDSDQPLQAEQRYSVLVNDYMYTGGSGYRFQAFDPAGYDTSIQWRQPVLDWVEAQNSSSSNPLDAALQALLP